MIDNILGGAGLILIGAGIYIGMNELWMRLLVLGIYLVTIVWAKVGIERLK